LTLNLEGCVIPGRNVLGVCKASQNGNSAIQVRLSSERLTNKSAGSLDAINHSMEIHAEPVLIA
jgi:hypothetical protein